MRHKEDPNDAEDRHQTPNRSSWQSQRPACTHTMHNTDMLNDGRFGNFQMSVVSLTSPIPSVHVLRKPTSVSLSSSADRHKNKVNV